MPSKPKPLQFKAARDFSIDGRTYAAGDEYVPDRFHARLIRGGFIAPVKAPKQGEPK